MAEPVRKTPSKKTMARWESPLDRESPDEDEGPGILLILVTFDMVHHLGADLPHPSPDVSVIRNVPDPDVDRDRSSSSSTPRTSLC